MYPVLIMYFFSFHNMPPSRFWSMQRRHFKSPSFASSGCGLISAAVSVNISTSVKSQSRIDQATTSAPQQHQHQETIAFCLRWRSCWQCLAAVISFHSRKSICNSVAFLGLFTVRSRLEIMLTYCYT